MSNSVETVEDVFEKGVSGFPSFKEFLKRPKYWTEKWNGSQDETLGFVDKGSQNLSRYVQRHEYEILGYRTKSLVEVEKIAKDNGISLDNYQAVCIPQSGFQCNILVKFMSNTEVKKRDGWA